MRILQFCMVLMLCASCYEYSCDEPDIRSVWSPEPSRRAISYSVITDSFISSHSFAINGVQDFYVDITDQYDGCTTYSQIVRTPYDCQDCEYQFVIDDQALLGPGKWNVKRFYLFRDSILIDSASTVNFPSGFGADIGVGPFVYNEWTGIVSYENDSLLIRQ